MKTLEEWQKYINEWADSKGWNEEVRPFGDTVSLLHTEISEAYEDYRDHREKHEIYFELNGVKVDDSIAGRTAFARGEAKPCGIPIELADLTIRILHFCESEGIDLDAMIAMKMQYNERRSHRHDGKKT